MDAGKGDVLPSDYDGWRQSRLARRMERASAEQIWNHLITVIVHEGASADDAALSRTLSALRGQTYLNVEVVLTGASWSHLPDPDDFVHLRGLFVQPTLNPLDVLWDPATERAWRGSHIVFAAAGTTFDPDAFALLNGMLSPTRGALLPDLVICDHDRLAGTGTTPEPCFLPGWDPDLIVGMDYVGEAFMASRKLIVSRRPDRRPDSLHAWLCSLAKGPLNVAHLTETIIHLPSVLPRPVSARPDAGSPPQSVAIVIPNRDQPDLLRRCVRFLEFFQCPKRELVIVDHASTDPATLTLYAELQERYGASILRVDGGFNFSHMVNLGVAATTAEIVLLVNNDIEITQAHQVEMMIAHAMRSEVGVVGAHLFYPDGTVQHAGMVMQSSLRSRRPMEVQHVLRGASKHEDGYLHALRTIRNYQAVTGALMATRRSVFDRAEGFDEVNLPVEYNDVDYCLRVRLLGFRIIVVPTDGIIHRESSTRGSTSTAEIERMRYASIHLMAERWHEAIEHDPFLNPHVDFGDRPQVRFPWTDEMAVKP